MNFISSSINKFIAEFNSVSFYLMEWNGFEEAIDVTDHPNGHKIM